MRRLLVIVSMAAALVAWGAGTAIAATGWAIQHTPSPAAARSPMFVSVSCGSLTSCTAVGGYAEGKIDRTLAEHWNGRSWKVQATSPDPFGSKDSRFYGVSCASARSCTAVGYATTKALAEHWNGRSWKIQTVPNPPHATDAPLTAISCTTGTSCTAVGDIATADSPSGKTLAEHWNGRTWKVQAMPALPSSDLDPGLAAVSCSSATACTATGSYFAGSGSALLAERWNGRSWKIQSVPRPSGFTDNQLGGVSCVTAANCTTVGFASTITGTVLTLAEHWNGETWAIQATRNPSGSPDAQLRGISCTSANSCTAVGWYTISSSNQNVPTLAEHWNGKTWAIQATPNPSRSVVGQLEDVSCSRSARCTAVGSYSTNPTGTGPSFLLAERD
jgi:hypothetical protein